LLRFRPRVGLRPRTVRGYGARGRGGTDGGQHRVRRSSSPAGPAGGHATTAGRFAEFLSIKAIDGFKVDAALWQPDGVEPDRTAILVQVHGSGSNLAELPLRAIARALSSKGYAALSISTRQHDTNINTDNFFDVRKDIEAAVATAKALGYTSIVLEGHSLGTIQVEYYAATNWDPAIKAVVLTGPFGKLPWKSRNIIIQDDDTYKELGVVARSATAAGKTADILPMKMPYLNGRRTPVTAQHFLTYRDEHSSAADGTYWIPHGVLLPAVRTEREVADHPDELRRR
jgi:pimeloyl-ACP methyl ester carboxylesterase